MNKKEYSQPKAQFIKVLSQEVMSGTSKIPTGGDTPPRGSAKENSRDDVPLWDEF